MAEPLGTVGRLQIHRAAVKADQVYDPAPLVAVDEASFDAGGMAGWDGSAWVLDNHHSSHPAAVVSPRRSVSVGFSAHYAAMRKRFGDSVVPGVAAENIIVHTDELMDIGRLGSGLEVRPESGEVLSLRDPLVAAPCCEFTSHLLGLEQLGSRAELADDLAFLSDGMRGFVFGTANIDQPILVTVGDPVYLAG
jgi:hypothetical protein